MTYKNQFVAEIKVNGKILRVKDNAVYLPFGCEYSILLKNLNSRRASVNVSIDGIDVLDGSSLILNPNDSSVLEGFMDANIAKNKFKFIQKTKTIQDHRGDKVDDGMIRIEFAYEKDSFKLNKPVIYESHYHSHIPFHWNYYTGDSLDNLHSTFYSNTFGSANNVSVVCSSENMFKANVKMDCLDEPEVDEGITVKGSEINQQFRYTSIGELNQSEVIVIRLKGSTQNQNIIKTPLTVKTKLPCETCGTKSKSSCKFCPECGTHLG